MNHGFDSGGPPITITITITTAIIIIVIAIAIAIAITIINHQHTIAQCVNVAARTDRDCEG